MTSNIRPVEKKVQTAQKLSQKKPGALEAWNGELKKMPKIVFYAKWSLFSYTVT